jgi:voltage-gated potassium channel
MSFRSRIYNIVDEDSRIGNVFNTLVIFLIIFNMVAIILESVQSLHGKYHFWFDAFENFCIVIFTFEYIARVLTADIKMPDLKGWRPFVKYIFSFMAMVDLLAILPSILLLVLPQGLLAELAFIRMLRIMRVFRVLKITRYSGSLKMMGDVLKDKLSDISVTIFIAFILMIIASTLMYYAEHVAQPDQFPDIVHAFWWAVATLTTVGYGDVYPVTALGKILSGVIAILGIGLVALPTGILSGAFVEKMEIAKQRKREEEAGKVEFEGKMPDCPHNTLIRAGEFPIWMTFCPLCGEQIVDDPKTPPNSGAPPPASEET